MSVTEEVYNKCDSLGTPYGDRWILSEGNGGQGLSTMSVDTSTFDSPPASIKIVAAPGPWGVYVSLNVWNYPQPIYTDFTAKPKLRFRVKSDLGDPATTVAIQVAFLEGDTYPRYYTYGSIKPTTVFQAFEIDLRQPDGGGVPDLTKVGGVVFIVDTGKFATMTTIVWIDTIGKDVGPQLTLSIDMSPKSATLTIGYNQVFSVSVLGGVTPYTYRWTADGVQVATTPTFDYYAPSIGNHTIRVTVTDSVGTSIYEEASVNVIPVPSPPEPTTVLHTFGHHILKPDNSEFYPRIIGTTGSLESASGMWGGKGEPAFAWSYKWEDDFSVLTRRMNDSLYCMATYWRCNIARFQLPVNWWVIDNVRARDFQTDAPDVTISNRNYWELVAQRAQANGMRVMFCFYSMFDVYTNYTIYGGIPGQLTPEGKAFLDTVNTDEMTAWRTIWQSIAARLGSYDNVDFELWNEPDDGTGQGFDTPQRQAFFNYCLAGYQGIRSVSNNIIYLTWTQGMVPTWNDLTWARDLHTFMTNALGHEPVNVIYAFHVYRHSPYFNNQWMLTYDGLYAQLAPIVNATRSSGIDIPTCVTESGILYGAIPSNELQNELNWWTNIIKVMKDLLVGFTQEYWMPMGIWSSNEAMFQTNDWPANAFSPTPTGSGQIFIDAGVIVVQRTLTVMSNLTGVPFTIRRI